MEMKNQPCPNCGGTPTYIELADDEICEEVYSISCKCGLSMHADTEEKAWEKWNAFTLRMGQVVANNCIMFGAECLYRNKHPLSKFAGAIPQLFYDTAAKKYKQWIEKHGKKD